MGEEEVFVTAAVEGDLDETLLRRLVADLRLGLVAVHGRQGKQFLLRQLRGYNNAAQHSPWIVVVDLDGDCNCAPPCVEQWLPNPAPHMRLRLAVRAVEAWLLSDRERIAQFLGARPNSVPSNPDELENPKRELVTLARGSRRRAIREELVPREGSGRQSAPCIRHG